MERGHGASNSISCAELRGIAHWKRICAASKFVRVCASCRNFVHLAILLLRNPNPNAFPFEKEPRPLSIRDFVSGLKSTHDRDFSVGPRGPVVHPSVRSLPSKLTTLLVSPVRSGRERFTNVNLLSTPERMGVSHRVKLGSVRWNQSGRGFGGCTIPRRTGRLST